MSTLTYADRDLIAAEAAEAKPARESFWVRLLNAFVAAQQRRADREIANYLAARGPLTDQMERDIMRRISGAGSL